MPKNKQVSTFVYIFHYKETIHYCPNIIDWFAIVVHYSYRKVPHRINFNFSESKSTYNYSNTTKTKQKISIQKKPACQTFIR